MSDSLESPQTTANPPDRPVATTETPSSTFQLDVPKLHSLPSEQQGLLLLTFTANLARHVDSLAPDEITAEQGNLKKELLQIVNLPSPAPSRVIRNNLSRCFKAIFTRGSRKVLYETINELVAIVNAGKEKELKAKHAATHCLGDILECAGDSAISLSPLVCASLLKLLKLASADTGLRHAIIGALGKVVKGIGGSIDEDVARTIWRQARAMVVSDKSLLAHARAAWCLEQLVSHTPYFDNTNDFEKLQVAVWKCMESPASPVRLAAASCLAAQLVKSYSERPNPDLSVRLTKPKKVKRPLKTEDLDDAIERPGSPAPEKPATALSYTLVGMLKILSTQFTKSFTTNRARAGIAVCYTNILRSLGESVVEQKYGEIAHHLFSEILNFQGWQFNRYRLILSRNYVRIILDKAVGGMLGESAQLNACRYLLNDIIRDYPQAVKERPEPSKSTLTGAISALVALIVRLDAAIGNIGETCREGLLQALQHPSFSVQVQAARALRSFAVACPHQLLPSVTICMNSVSRELSLLAGPRQSPRRCVGYAYGLAAILSTSSLHPLYGSVDVYARVLQQATTLLKSSGSSDLRISSSQLQVAWIMIGGLMSLGPNFVKIHLPQLMLLWRNALPKPVSKDNIAQRTMLELSYLTHVRECALGSVKAFLTYNQRLLTVDISRRLSAMLENTVLFLQGLPSKKTSDEPSNRLSPALQLQDYDIMVRRRVFQCFSQLLVLSTPGSIEPTAQSAILPLAVLSFCDVEYDAPTSLSAAIASAAGTFESIWDVGDNYGFGVSGLLRGLELRNPINAKPDRHWSMTANIEAEIDHLISSPISAAPENDPTCCYLEIDDRASPMPVPAATEAVDAAIAVFGLSLPLQTPKVQESVLEQVSGALSAISLQKDPARKAAVTVNTVIALSMAVRVATGEAGSIRGDLKSPGTEKGLQAILHACIRDTDDSVRLVAASALGRLCSSSGTAFTSGEVIYLTGTIVNNREPFVRAGCALALAQIHSQLGGMAAGLHMKNIVGILMSLAADTHPLVHYWALDSLAGIAESAGLNFSGYVTGAIGMLSQLYASDTHNAETPALASSNMLVTLPVSTAVARGVDAVINVLGPDLQDTDRARDMILTLARLFSQEDDSGTLLQSLACFEHLTMYAPAYVDLVEYIHRLQDDLNSQSSEISRHALQSLSTLMRRDAPRIIQLARPGLEDRFWDYLTSDPYQPAIRSTFQNWLQQTGSSDPADWIQRCSNILTKTKAKVEPQKQVKESTGPDLQDEEVAGFAVTAGASKEDDSQAATSAQELMRWQVRYFAMECLHNLIATIRKEAAVMENSPGEQALQQKVSDVIRIAFSASTAGVVGLSVIGLQIIDQVLKMFGRTPDPDFPEAMLLEQYQAQISSALTPAFAADSSPELAAAAVNVCATFTATGIVTDVERMGRILKVLKAALESFSKDTDVASIGDLKALSANAQVMVRMAVFAAWAELQISSAEQAYLVDIVKPHIAQLVPLWLSSLREYARLRFEPDISATTASPLASGDLDLIYAALNRETLMKFYQTTWLSLVDAIASLIDEDSEVVFDALDGKQPTHESGDANGINSENLASKQTGINYREEPVAFFFVLYGLTFESLAVRHNSSEDSITRQRNLDILEALKKILRPSVSGNAIYQEVVFAETMDLLDRMVLTESLSVQTVIVEIARNLCICHPSSRQGVDNSDPADVLSDDIEQLFELTRIIILVIAGLVPGLSSTPVSINLETSEEARTLLRASLQALVDVSDVFPSIIKTDLHASIFFIFITIFGTPSCQTSIVPLSLPIFRRFIASISEENRPETLQQTTNALSQMLTILKNARGQESEASLPCQRNILLACTILSTGADPILGPENMLVHTFVEELKESIENPMTTKVAAGCYRTLLAQGIAPRLVFARAIEYLVKASDNEPFFDTKLAISQVLTTFTIALPAEQKLSAITLLINVLLIRAGLDGPTSYQYLASRLLELATSDSATFRNLVSSMPADRKTLLEQVLKSQATSRGPQKSSDAEYEPTIALKMNFGG